jgi:hypothetical protein
VTDRWSDNDFIEVGDGHRSGGDVAIATMNSLPRLMPRAVPRRWNN